MQMICLHDKGELERFLRGNVYLHIYSIGDLDDFFWQNTTWYALKNNENVQAIALLYTASSLPTLLAMSENKGVMEELLVSILHILPKRFYAHLSPGVEIAIEESYKMASHGEHSKMALTDRSLIYNHDCSDVVRLTNDDLDEILQLYKESYPGNWFDPRMLETTQYFGIRVKGRLVSIAGIHIYSERYKVAALGNIVTHPDYRNNGFAKATTARLCQSLCETVDHIGLNVKSDNETAIAMYKKLGFKVSGAYGEYMVESK